MLKKFKVLTALTLALTVVPTLGTSVYAEEAVVETVTVTTQEALKAAVSEKKPKIELGADIQMDAKLDITYDVEIDGKNYTLSGPSTPEWSGHYILHIYKANATIKNITLTGGDAGLLVNGSKVSVENIDVSGNEFGGIEVSQGKNVTEASELTILGKIKNTTDEPKKPTIWVVADQGTVVGADKFTTSPFTTEEGIAQTHYHLKEEVVDEGVKTAAEFEAAIAAGQSEIKLGASIELTQKVNIFHDVTIDGQGHTIKNANPQVGWAGEYALQFYNVNNAVLGNVTFEDFDAAVLVNGSTLTVNGNLTFNNMEFGGIELTQGKNVTNVPAVKFEEVTVTHDTEDYGVPTLWIDGTEGTVESDKIVDAFLFERTDIKENQTQYYLNAITDKEIDAIFASYTHFSELSTKELEVKLIENTANIQITKLGSKLTAEDIVEAFVKLIGDNADVKAYEFNGVLYTEVEDKEALTAQLTEIFAALSTPAETRAALTDINVDELLKTPFNFRLHIDVNGTVVPANEVLVQLSEKVDAPVVDPVKPEEGKDKDKEKTPATGIQDNLIMYSSILVLGAILIVSLRSKRKFFR